jgi:hypothetical protein
MANSAFGQMPKSSSPGTDFGIRPDEILTDFGIRPDEILTDFGIRPDEIFGI